MEEFRPTVIRVENVSKDFVLPHQRANSVKSLVTGFYGRKTTEPQHALDDISLEIKQGEFFGIVGRNGSGKSTLLKILANIYQPTKGKVKVAGKLIPFIELGVGFNPELTGRENVYLNGAMLGFSVSEIDKMYDDIVSFAELERFMDQKLKNYSSGMQVRLAFSMATRADADILLIDEVLAVGDADFQRKCFDYFKELKRKKKTVVFVSHDMAAVREFCDRAMLIESSKNVLIGKTEMVAGAYARLFLKETTTENKEELIPQVEDNRWGNFHIKIENVSIKQSEDRLRIIVTARSRRNVDRLIYGIHIISSDGSEVTAMNNRMINEPDIEGIKKGMLLEFNWDMLNIFNDGQYVIKLTLVNETGQAYDWFENAATFRVKRAERSTTAVLPPTKVKHVIKEDA